jgi:hypothetical protein
LKEPGDCGQARHKLNDTKANESKMRISIALSFVCATQL